MLRLAVLASGSGSNFQAIVDAARKGYLGLFQPVLLVTDRPCGSQDRADTAGIESVCLNRSEYGENLSSELGRLLISRNIDFAALAGWLSILDGRITAEWKGRMVNIHPSLLPLHGGRGMYGQRVHRAVLDAGDSESGCTVHYVTDRVDEGDVLGQLRVPVLENDTPESLAERVLAEEHKLYPEVLAELSGSLKTD
jgi:phosphoribosylglycinamide formyltransferase-1